MLSFLRSLCGLAHDLIHDQGPVRLPWPSGEYDVGDGYTVWYLEKPNGLGGYYSANMVLCRRGKSIREITDMNGTFRRFPGVVHGDWEEKQTSPFAPRTRFDAHVGKFQNGRALFSWTLQPDGRYYAGGDGFGWEKDEEIVLYSLLNRQGVLVTRFSTNVPEGYTP